MGPVGYGPPDLSLRLAYGKKIFHVLRPVTRKVRLVSVLKGSVGRRWVGNYMGTILLGLRHWEDDAETRWLQVFNLRNDFVLEAANE